MKKASNIASNKHQRWAREKYNAYQRFYMQTMRAVKAGRAMLLGARP